MTKMDMIWIATANFLYPETSPSLLVSRMQIEKEVFEIFDVQITPVMIERHLVSWCDRQADKLNPSRGGSRNRYLFRTEDGFIPSGKGNFRLYKSSDNSNDGWEKTGPTHPDKNNISTDYHYLIEWYKNEYSK